VQLIAGVNSVGFLTPGMVGKKANSRNWVRLPLIIADTMSGIVF